MEARGSTSRLRASPVAAGTLRGHAPNAHWCWVGTLGHDGSKPYYISLIGDLSRGTITALYVFYLLYLHELSMTIVDLCLVIQFG